MDLCFVTGHKDTEKNGFVVIYALFFTTKTYFWVFVVKYSVFRASISMRTNFRFNRKSVRKKKKTQDTLKQNNPDPKAEDGRAVVPRQPQHCFIAAAAPE